MEYKPNLEKTLEALRKNNLNPQYAENKEKALALVMSLIPDGASIASGGSVTLSSLGVFDALKKGNYNYLDRSAPDLTEEQKRKLAKESQICDVFLSGSNAITENGELYNVDGRSNRVAALLYGPDRVIIVAGINKIVPDINAAIKRVRNIAAPLNCKRLGIENSCYYTGHCVAEDRDGGLFDGCASDGRICCNYTVMAHQRVKNRVNVIIVGENLGF